MLRGGITRQKDFWTGAIYVVIGAAGLLIAQRYNFGSTARMGPGYFPTLVSLLLVLVGVAVVGRSLLTQGGYIQAFVWRPILCITASIAAFGFLITRAGLIAAALVLVLGSAAGSRRFRLALLPLLGLAALIAFCTVVFVYGIGVPMPLVGPWLGGDGY